MPALRSCWFLPLAALLLLPLPARAEPPVEKIPAPRPLPQTEIIPPPPLLYPPLQPPVRPEFGKRSVWQFYGVDRAGRFRPLVIQGPYRSFYRYDLTPYPWTGNRTDHQMPFIVR
jgi:hypothetical protein